MSNQDIFNRYKINPYHSSDLGFVFGNISLKKIIINTVCNFSIFAKITNVFYFFTKKNATSKSRVITYDSRTI